VQRQNKFTSKQTMLATLPLEPPRHEPAPEVEKILMVDFITTPARAKGAAPFANREGGGQTGAAVTKTLSTLPSPTTDGLDRMYRQLVKIHTIATTQLAECAR
jgi:hypothetical protein